MPRIQRTPTDNFVTLILCILGIAVAIVIFEIREGDDEPAAPAAATASEATQTSQ